MEKDFNFNSSSLKNFQPLFFSKTPMVGWGGAEKIPFWNFDAEKQNFCLSAFKMFC